MTKEFRIKGDSGEVVFKSTDACLDATFTTADPKWAGCIRIDGIISGSGSGKDKVRAIVKGLAELVGLEFVEVATNPVAKPVAEPKTSGPFLAVAGTQGQYSTTGKILDSVSFSSRTLDQAIRRLERNNDEEFEVFQRVAVVGAKPKPQPLPERVITKDAA